MRNLDTFIGYLMPDLDEGAIAGIDPQARRFIESQLTKLLDDDNLSIEQVANRLDLIRDNRLLRQTTRGGTPPDTPPWDPLSLIGLASFTMAALVAGTVASHTLKTNYDELIDTHVYESVQS